VDCGVDLTDEDVMKVVLEDGSYEIIPFSRCPECFAKELKASSYRDRSSANTP
jgi:hypothetical protein